MDESILSEWNPKNLHFKVTTKSATMNAYIYEAKERSVIGKPVTGGNKQVEAGDTFQTDPKSGFLIIFYNSDATDGQFGFEYWVEATKKTKEEIEAAAAAKKEEAKGGFLEDDMMMYILIGVAALLLIVLVIICCVCCKRKSTQINDIEK